MRVFRDARAPGPVHGRRARPVNVLDGQGARSERPSEPRDRTRGSPDAHSGMCADWLERGGRADAVVLVALPLRDPEQGPLPPPRLPAGTFVVAAEDDQFGKADELRAALPDARLAVVPDAEHFFIGKRDEAVRLVCDELARAFAVPSHLP